jgi:hypothetical protein
MLELSTENIRAFAEHWEKLAVAAEQQAAWDRHIGIDLSRPGHSPGDHRAALYRRTAHSIYLEIDTGKPHCNCCLQPRELCEYDPRNYMK